MRYVTVDMSTKFLAYAMWDDGKLIRYGKVFPIGKDDNAIASFATETAKTFENDGVEFVVYEAAFLGKNVNVIKGLSKATGAMLGGFYSVGVHSFKAVPPITWQTGIGVGRTSKPNIEALRKKYPSRSLTWIKTKDRENRKQLIIDLVNKEYGLNLKMDDNDIADAIGIGLYYWRTK